MTAPPPGPLGLDYAGMDGNRPDAVAAVAGGVRFVIMRASHGASPDLPLDPKRPTAARSTYVAHRPRWRAAGAATGAYGIIEWGRVPAREQALALVAQFRRANVDATDRDLVAVDVEFSKGRRATMFSAPAAIQRVEEVVAVVRAELGIVPLIYTSARVWREDLGEIDSASLSACPLWIKTPYPMQVRRPANMAVRGPMTALPRPWRRGGTPGVWVRQFQGDAVGFVGQTGTVDLNEFLPWAGEESTLLGDRTSWLADQLGAPVGASAGEIRLALRAYQASRGLQTDGVAGPLTLAALLRD